MERYPAEPGSVAGAPRLGGEGGARQRCPRCLRYRFRCLCAAIPSIDNLTEVIILQHPRERLHPFGTASIAERGLVRCRVEVLWELGRGTRRLRLPASARLLYPGGSLLGGGLQPAARGVDGEGRALCGIGEVPRPAPLVILDGTWHHARAIVKAYPELAELPRVSLKPAYPSRYRIRREPTAAHVSTIEAIVEALTLLEPELAGLERLLHAFDTLIDQQLATVGQSRVRRRRRQRPALAGLPGELLGPAHRLLIVYAESVARGGALRDQRQREIVQLAAQRASGGETWVAYAQRPQALQPFHLAHMGLPAERVADGLSPAGLAHALGQLMSSDDVVVAWNRSTLDLLLPFELPPRTLPLKAVYCNVTGRPSGTLEGVIEREHLEPRAVDVEGRAARRLGQCWAVLEWLRARASGAAAQRHSSATRR